MKVLVTGVTGQLGYEVVKCLTNKKIECIGVGRAEFDLLNKQAAQRYIEEYNPDVVVHCSAYTAVDKAEEERDLCESVNVEGTRNIAEVCKKIGAKLLYISTDYVYSGTGVNFWQPEDKTNPINWYGETKWRGEEIVRDLVPSHFILRISWAFGKNGNNFVKTMLRLGRERNILNVVGDQIGSPTYMVDLASLIVAMIYTDKYGTYNVSNEGVCSWADFATEIFKQAKINCQVKAIASADYPTAAKRPLNSRMSKDKLEIQGFTRLPEWQDALARYLKEL